MKSRTIIRLAVLGLLVLIVAVGCDLFGDDSVSKSERIKQFESDINNNLSNVYKNIHPGVAGFDEMRTPAYWGDGDSGHFPPDDRPFTVSVTISGNTATGQVLSVGTVGPRNVSFRFKEDGSGVWKIDRIELPPPNVIVPAGG